MTVLVYPRRELRRWVICATVVVCAHLFPAAAYLRWADAAPVTAAPPPAAMLLELAPMPRSMPAYQAPAGPEQIDTPSPPEPEPELSSRPEPDPEPEPEPAETAEIALPESRPELLRPIDRAHTRPEKVKPRASATSLPPPTDHAEQAPVAAGPAGVESTVQADARLSFQQLLLAHLERHKQYPYSSQRRRQEGVAYLWFRMNKEGEVLAFELQRSSGHRALDREVRAMIGRAEPLPAIPAALGQERLELVVPVEFAIRR